MDTLAKLTPERFAEGLTLDEFVQGMSKNRETFEENYGNVTLKPEDASALRSIEGVAGALVLAEDWCGDVLRYVPVLKRMSEAAGWQVRLLYRDENPDLADLWKKEGRFRSIPVIVFFDRDFNELACFVEKPAGVVPAETGAREDFAAQHPDLEDAALPVDKMSPETLDLYTRFIRRFRADNVSRWQQLFVDEIISKLG